MISSLKKTKEWFSKWSKQLVSRWLAFAKKHEDSHRLPIALFLLLTIDGFVTFLPSVLLLIGAVTISARRWFTFGFIFTAACTLNNVGAYCLGRLLSPDTLVSIIEKFHLESVWHSAERALHAYGSYATFVGAVVGLPTQIIMVLIGIADMHMLQDDPTVSTSFVKAILLSLLGHSIKGWGVAGLTRFGWIKLEKKFGSSTPS